MLIMPHIPGINVPSEQMYFFSLLVFISLVFLLSCLSRQSSLAYFQRFLMPNDVRTSSQIEDIGKTW